MKITWSELRNLVMLGVLLGGAGLVPGFSSGTLAFVTGLYGLLIATFSNVFNKPKSLESWGKLAILVTSMALGAFVISVPLNVLLDQFEIPLMWVFTGFILASIIPISREIKRLAESPKMLNLSRFLTVLTVVLLTSAILSLELTQDTTLSLTGRGIFFLSAFFASLAGLLPGISGSVVWIGMGQYSRYLTAIETFVWTDLMLFVIATLMGYVLFARLIESLLKKNPLMTYAMLLGLTLSSVLWIVQIEWTWSFMEWAINVILPFVLGYGLMYGLYQKIIPMKKESV